MKRTLLFCVLIVFFTMSFVSLVGCSDNKKVDYQLQDKCRKSSQEYSNNQIVSKSYGTTNWEYENHYNKKINKCFMLTTGIHTNGDMITKLISVNENKEYGYYVSIGNVFNGCEFFGKTCKSKEEWDLLVKPYMEE